MDDAGRQSAAAARAPLVPAFTALAAACALTATAWWLARPWLLERFAGFYGNWRDAYLTVRLTNGPLFFALLAAVAAGAALLVPVGRRLDRHLDDDGAADGAGDRRPLFLAGLVAAAVLVGLPLSLQEWQAYGLPCWDGYCERGALWAAWLGEPSFAGLGELFAATSRFHTGASLLPPALIGAVAATGASVISGFLVVNLLAWVAVALLTVRLARRHLDLSPTATAVALLLLFAHLATQRSLLFPQTDPLAVAAVLLALAALLAWLRRPAPGTAAALFAALLLGLLTKLSFAPMLAAAPLAVALGADGEGRDGRLGRTAVAGLAFSLAPAAVFVTFLSATGLLPALLFELGFIAGRDAPAANFYADNNPLRFTVAAAASLQLAPLLLLSRRFRLRLAEDPRRRLLAALVVLFVVSLVALRTAFWPRYFLPVIPLVALLAAGPLVGAVPGRFTRVVLGAAYLAGNALFLATGMYY